VKLWTISSYDMELRNADFALKDLEQQVDDNSLSLDNYPSRLARTALRAYMQKFMDLEWMPGGLRIGTWTGDEYARLYREKGWPSSFNRSAFNIARTQWEKDDAVREEAEAPLEKVKQLEANLKGNLDNIAWRQKQIGEVDAGKELPQFQTDRDAYRQSILDEIQTSMEYLPEIQKQLEAARAISREVDPLVKKAREDRIDKYGY
jgi:hypothetical protein